MFRIPFINVRPEGHLFIVIFVVVAIVFFTVAQWLGFIGIILVGWCIYFFRDPDRVTPIEDGLIISPADGVIQMVGDAAPPPELDMGEVPMRRVSIFMNVFDCHVNRSPANGEIQDIFYKPGKFLNASLDKASEENERNYIKITNKKGEEIIIVQIAGMIARRIVCECYKDQVMNQGDRVGMIRFGSRVDIYYQNFKTLAKENQTTVAGETLIAKI